MREVASTYQAVIQELLWLRISRAAIGGSVTDDEEDRYTDMLDGLWEKMSHDERLAVEDWFKARSALAPTSLPLLDFEAVDDPPSVPRG